VLKYSNLELNKEHNIKEKNTLMIRLAFEKQVDKKNKKQVFSFFEYIMIPFLFTQTNQLNELDWDYQFLKQFMDQTDVYSDDDNDGKKSFANYCLKRIERRLQLVSFIIAVQNRKKTE